LLRLLYLLLLAPVSTVGYNAHSCISVSLSFTPLSLSCFFPFDPLAVRFTLAGPLP